MKYSLEHLSNGLMVVSVPIEHLKSATVMLLVGAGSRYEEKRINGISHFLEHMAFKGTQKRPSALAISTEIDSIGGEFNAFTSKDHTGYYIKAASKHIPLLFDVLSDMLLNSKLDSAEIDKERGVIIEEINMYEDMPIRKIGEVYESLLYGNRPLGWDISGTAENIKAIMREDFVSYMSRLYHPENAVLVVAGGIEDGLVSDNAKSVASLAEKYFGMWRGNRGEGFLPVADKQEKPGLLVKYKDTSQAHLCIGFRAYHNRHPKRYALSVLSAILGGGMSSRLFIEVREKRGLAYYVRSSSEQYQDVGNFVTQAGVDVKRIETAVQVMLAEFDKVRLKAVSVKELEKAKELLKGRVTLSIEDSRNVASAYSSSLLLEGEIETPDEVIEKISKVTSEDVLAVAREIFTDNRLNLAIIGPYKKEENFLSILKV